MANEFELFANMPVESSENDFNRLLRNWEYQLTLLLNEGDEAGEISVISGNLTILIEEYKKIMHARNKIQKEIVDFNNETSQSEEIFLRLHDDFLKLNESLNEIYQKQSFAEIKWYPEILQKVSLWSINMLDERMSRDFTRSDIIAQFS